jgi:hypothetical protein
VAGVETGAGMTPPPSARARDDQAARVPTRRRASSPPSLLNAGPPVGAAVRLRSNSEVTGVVLGDGFEPDRLRVQWDDSDEVTDCIAAKLELRPRADVQGREGAVREALVEGGETSPGITGRLLMVGVLVLALLIIIDQKNYDGRYVSATSDMIKRMLSSY